MNRLMTMKCLALLLLGLTPFAMAAEPAMPTSAQTAPLEFGAVLDVRAPSPQGIPVLAITPGGVAERLGLRAGDRLLAINGQRLDAAAEPANLLRQSLATGADRVQIDALRNGATLSVVGAAGAVEATAASDGCGYVTVLGVTPRLKQKIYLADITRIDGKSTPLFPVNRHRMPAGRHVLVVRELIPSHIFSTSQLRQRGLMMRREKARAYKALVVDVPADTILSIGARLLPERSSTEDFRENRYWEPVVWNSKAESCR